jgi:hypothetical protein
MRIALLAATLLLSLTGSTGMAAVPIIQCAEALLPGVEYKLTSDLDCQLALTAFYVPDRATLNSNGHTLISGDIGVRLVGQGATVRNGTIRAPTAVQLDGAVHSVKNITTVRRSILDRSYHSQIINNSINGPIIATDFPNFGAGSIITGNTVIGGCTSAEDFRQLPITTFRVVNTPIRRPAPVPG